jgi:hypothetical protein
MTFGSTTFPTIPFWLDDVPHDTIDDQVADRDRDGGPRAVLEQRHRHARDHGDRRSEVGDEVEQEGEHREENGKIDLEDEEPDADGDGGDEARDGFDEKVFLHLARRPGLAPSRSGAARASSLE